MANNNDGSRRDHSRPVDNPFIAFRRFADSQVSSLLNTVFTLPATIANYNNAHEAREQCLFGKVDKRQCDKLHQIEADIVDLHGETRDLFRAGDMQAVVRRSEELMRLDRQADDIRRKILGVSAKESRRLRGQDDAELVERVANQKGQEWGWMWDWGFPRPFDYDNWNSTAGFGEDTGRNHQEVESLLRLQAEARRLAVEYDDKAWDDPQTDVAKFNNYTNTQTEDRRPGVWSWSKSWQWPPPADASESDDVYSPRVLEESEEMKKAGVEWRAAYEDLVRAEQSERPHCMRSDGPSSRGTWPRRKIPLSQQQLEEALDHHQDPRCPRLVEPGKVPITQEQLEETMERNEHPRCPRLADLVKIPITQQQLEDTIERGDQPGCPHGMDTNAQDEPSYEYSHDHEDQHDDPPSPKQSQFIWANAFSHEDKYHDTVTHQSFEPTRQHKHELVAQLDKDRDVDDTTYRATEMDAYEQLDAVSRSAAPTAFTSSDPKPSILSTLTTTERTVAPDGSVTTKVVLKKRFADGREESSETIQTQRGQQSDSQTQDPWRVLQATPSSAAAMDTSKNGEPKKRNGWFWSS